MKKKFAFPLIIFLLLFTSCEDEPIGKMNINRDTIEVDSELYGLIARIATLTDDPIDCIAFNYSFPLFTFDENMGFIDVISITDNEQFSNFLSDLPDSYSISLSYPITGTLNSGELIDINNNQDLKEAIDACVKDEYQRYCNNTLRDCVWEIKPFEGYPTIFEGAAFKINDQAIAEFHLDNTIYFGTWTTLYIGDELHLNININDEGLIAGAWNFDWLILSLSEDVIELATNNTISLLEKNCTLDCSIGRYQACELEPNAGIAEFSLEDYLACNVILNTHDLISPLVFTFYETQENAIDGINPISNTAYLNTENPQIIYIRIEYLETGEVLGFSEITIEAISC